jgi:hypothetical protein
VDKARKKPPISTTRGIRLYDWFMYWFYPSFAQVTLKSVNVASCGAKYDNDRKEAEETDYCEGEVGAGEKVPGLHEWFA